MLKIETPPAKFVTKEELYFALREKEGRIYMDAEVKQLPHVIKAHPLRKEWKVRKHTTQKLINYCSTKKSPLRILEIGCGNGWLCYQLSSIPNCTVVGLDINMQELEQADRVFGNNTNISFVYGDIFENILKGERFDIIVFASSIQYFTDIDQVLERVFSFLRETGEIHIIDSPLYKTDKDALDAKGRSTAYFCHNHAAGMAQYYNHHTRRFLQKLNYRLIEPSVYERIFKISCFPWIVIRHK